MRRAVISIVLGLVAPLVAVVGTVPAATAEPAAAPPVKHVVRGYGDGPVRLAARQGADITFPARRGDQVTLEVRDAKHGSAACSGRTTVVDRRGARTTSLDRVVRVRTTGQATLRFRGRCGHTGMERLPVEVQLVKVRMRKVPVESATRVRAARRGFVDVAWTTVPATGRVKLTARRSNGRSTPALGVLVGAQRLWTADATASVEHGERLVIDNVHDDRDLPVLRRGTRVGLVVADAGTVDARRAVTHTVQLDGPAVSLPSDRGREQVVSVEVPAGVRTYLEDGEGDHWTYSDLDRDDQDPTAARTHRLVVSSDEDAPASERMHLRVRTIREAPDLVVNGPPVRLESTDPGQLFVARVAGAEPGAVRLTAGEVTVSGGAWLAEVTEACRRDCIDTGLRVSDTTSVADGHLHDAAADELVVRFRPGASGGVTLRLTR